MGLPSPQPMVSYWAIRHKGDYLYYGDDQEFVGPILFHTEEAAYKWVQSTVDLKDEPIPPEIINIDLILQDYPDTRTL